MIDQRLLRDVRLKANPILRQELNKIPFALRLRRLLRYFWLIVVFVTAATAIISFGGGLSYCSQPYRSCRVSDLTLYSINESLFPVIAIGSLLIGLLFDFYYVGLPAGRLLREKKNGQWEMLRTTTFPITQIIASKYASAQIRAWRILALEVALRAAVGVVLFSSFVLSAPYQTYSSYNDFYTLEQVLLIITGVVFILEPIWRMRMVVSMGLALAMQMRSHTSVALADFGALLLMRIAQAILVYLYVMAMSLLARAMASNYYGPSFSDWLLVFMVGGFGLCIYAFYRIGRRALLRRALRVALYPVYR